MDSIIECVPNFSEGRDDAKIERIVGVFRAAEEVRVLDYSSDRDHNRMVVTVAGEPSAVGRAVVAAVGMAIEEIDLNTHSGEHPRIGAVDVIPFIPIRGITMRDAVDVSKEVAWEIAARWSLPVYLYEKSASAPARENLADIRRGGYEGLPAKMSLPEWKPDFGPSHPHPTAGAVAVGARMPLIAYNINLNTDDLRIAKEIARKVRFSNGGLPFVKAMGVELRKKGIVQVSMNLVDYTKTPVWKVQEAVEAEARRLGVTIAGSELIGLIPQDAVTDIAAHYLSLDDFSSGRIIETRLSE